MDEFQDKQYYSEREASNVREEDFEKRYIIEYQDLEVIESFYHQKLQKSVHSEAYFILNQIHLNLRKNMYEFKKSEHKFQAPVCKKIIEQIQMENYCVVCFKFMNPNSPKTIKLYCPICQCVNFCSGYCSLEKSSHPCDYLNRIKIKSMLLDPEIQNIRLQTNNMIKKQIQQKEAIIETIQNEYDSVEVAKSLQIDIAMHQTEIIIREADTYFNLQVKPIYQQILKNKELYNENSACKEFKSESITQQSLLENKLDPFLYPYFIRICQILSCGIRKIRENTKLVESRTVDINNQVNNIQKIKFQQEQYFKDILLFGKTIISPSIQNTQQFKEIIQKLKNFVDYSLLQNNKFQINIEYDTFYKNVIIQLYNKSVRNKLNQLLGQNYQNISRTNIQSANTLKLIKQYQTDLIEYNCNYEQAVQRLSAAKQETDNLNNLILKFHEFQQKDIFQPNQLQILNQLFSKLLNKTISIQNNNQKEKQINYQFKVQEYNNFEYQEILEIIQDQIELVRQNEQYDSEEQSNQGSLVNQKKNINQTQQQQTKTKQKQYNINNSTEKSKSRPNSTQFVQNPIRAKTAIEKKQLQQVNYNKVKNQIQAKQQEFQQQQQLRYNYQFKSNTKQQQQQKKNNFQEKLKKEPILINQLNTGDSTVQNSFEQQFFKSDTNIKITFDQQQNKQKPRKAFSRSVIFVKSKNVAQPEFNQYIEQLNVNQQQLQKTQIVTELQQLDQSLSEPIGDEFTVNIPPPVFQIKKTKMNSQLFNQINDIKQKLRLQERYSSDLMVISSNMETNKKLSKTPNQNNVLQEDNFVLDTLKLRKYYIELIKLLSNEKRRFYCRKWKLLQKIVVSLQNEKGDEHFKFQLVTNYKVANQNMNNQSNARKQIILQAWGYISKNSHLQRNLCFETIIKQFDGQKQNRIEFVKKYIKDAQKLPIEIQRRYFAKILEFIDTGKELSSFMGLQTNKTIMAFV